MSSTKIQVTTATLKNKRDDLMKANKNFKAKLNELNGMERNLTAMWEGEASTVFHKRFDKEQNKMEDLYKVVEQYCVALETIIEQYENSEQKNVSIASK